jgi:hypothetical protein
MNYAGIQPMLGVAFIPLLEPLAAILNLSFQESERV